MSYMAEVRGAACTNAGGTWYTITPALIAGVDWGYINGFYGSVSDVNFKGVEIDGIFGDVPSGYDLRVSLGPGPLTKGFFSGILVQTTSGSWRYFATSQAHFAIQAWTWTGTGGVSPIYTDATVRPFLLTF